MRITSEHINENGCIDGLREQNAVVVGLSYREGGAFCMDLLRVDGHVGKLTLSLINQFGFRGFRNGCVVSRIRAWPPLHTPTCEAATQKGAWAVLYGNDIPVEHLPPILIHVRDSASESSAFLVHVDSSYGGSFAALCGAIDLEDC